METGEEKRISFQAVNSPHPPILWQAPQAAWLFWQVGYFSLLGARCLYLTGPVTQVVLEVDMVEVTRWSADWITDASGVVCDIPFSRQDLFALIAAES